MLVAELHVDAAIRAFYDMEVGQDMAAVIEDETGSLAFLRNRTIEEVEDHLPRRNIDDGRKYAFVDRDVVQLFGVVGRGRVGFRQLQRRIRRAQMLEQGHIAEMRGKMGGQVPEPAYKKHNQKKVTQFHSHRTKKPFHTNTAAVRRSSNEEEIRTPSLF